MEAVEVHVEVVGVIPILTGMLAAVTGYFIHYITHRHHHQWTEHNRIFQAPCMPKTWKGDQTKEFLDFLRESKWGFTVVELHCECGEPKFVKVIGDARSRISAVSERAPCP